MDIQIRKETENDIPAIENAIKQAFRDIPQSDGTEHLIVRKLRDTGAMVLSLVALHNDKIIGHIAFSEVNIGEVKGNWFGLAPLTVVPGHQSRGIGSALVRKGIHKLKEMDASGCVLAGEPSYYSRFGFQSYRHLRCAGIPDEYVMAICFKEQKPFGDILYDPAFNLEEDG